MKIYQPLVLLLCFFLLPFLAKGQVIPPKITCVNKLIDGSLELAWIKEDPNISGTTCGNTFSAYEIYKSNNPDGPFVSLITINDQEQLTYIDTEYDGSTTYYYIVKRCGNQVSNPSAMASSENPEPPIIEKIDVLTDELVEIVFSPSIATEAFGYLIYGLEPNRVSFSPRDTVLIDDLIWNGTFFVYYDSLATPGLFPEAYNIASFDECFSNQTAIEVGNTSTVEHKSVHLTITNSDCESEFELEWTAYQGWGSELVEYEVNVVDTTVVPPVKEVVATVPASQNTYDYTLPQEKRSACFTVIARGANGQRSNSNSVCASLTATNGPEYIYLKNITVDGDNAVILDWNIDIDNPITLLSIIRGTKDSLQLGFLTDVLGPYTENMQYLDMQTETDKFPYFYRLQHTDECNRQFRSTYGSTIYLRGRDQFNQTNGLEWSPFELTYSTLIQYDIYRSVGESNDFEFVQSITGVNNTNFQDVLTDVEQAPSYCYYIEATYELNLPGEPTETLTSRSNIFCIQQTARVFLPNAFTPNEAANNVFKPKLLFENDENYSMVVFNRWGKVVFKTSVPSEGWDGTVEGVMAPQGAYAYSITMQTDSGYMLERKGTVLLIR